MTTNHIKTYTVLRLLVIMKLTVHVIQQIITQEGTCVW